MVTLTYYRFHAPGTAEYDSVEDAIAGAFWMIEENTAAPDTLLAEDGSVLFDHDTLRDRIREYEKETWDV